MVSYVSALVKEQTLGNPSREGLLVGLLIEMNNEKALAEIEGQNLGDGEELVVDDPFAKVDIEGQIAD